MAKRRRISSSSSDSSTRNRQRRDPLRSATAFFDAARKTRARAVAAVPATKFRRQKKPHCACLEARATRNTNRLRLTMVPASRRERQELPHRLPFGFALIDERVVHIEKNHPLAFGRCPVDRRVPKRKLSVKRRRRDAFHSRYNVAADFTERMPAAAIRGVYRFSSSPRRTR